MPITSISPGERRKIYIFYTLKEVKRKLVRTSFDKDVEVCYEHKVAGETVLEYWHKRAGKKRFVRGMLFDD